MHKNIFLIFLAGILFHLISPAQPQNDGYSWFYGAWDLDIGNEQGFSKIVIKAGEHPNIRLRLWHNGTFWEEIEGNKAINDRIVAVFKGPDGGKYSAEFIQRRTNPDILKLVLTHISSFGETEQEFFYNRGKDVSVATPYGKDLPVRANPVPVPEKKPVVTKKPSGNVPAKPLNPAPKPQRTNPTVPTTKPAGVAPGRIVAGINNCKDCDKFYISVYGESTGKSVKLNGKSQASFEDLKPGTYSISVSYGGKTDAIVPVKPSSRQIVVKSGQTAKVQFQQN